MSIISKSILALAKSFHSILFPKTVFINDYQYNPRNREGLRTSKIKEILDNWYASNMSEILDLAENLCSLKTHYEKIPFTSNEYGGPNWSNLYLPPLDAVSLYGFLVKYNPRYYVEVGSGNTTMFAAQSIRDNNLRTRIISIDPNPRSEIDKLCYEIHRMPFEDIDVSFFNSLSCEDILLVDNSHRSFPNSDVTVFFSEVLPKLPSGMLYAIHDIFLPMDYPEIWTVKQKRFYNEQYLLCAYILGGAGGDRIIAPLAYLSNKIEFIKACDPLFGKGKLLDGYTDRFGAFHGGLFWMQKR